MCICRSSLEEEVDSRIGPHHTQDVGKPMHSCPDQVPGMADVSTNAAML
jgi:hypothetical protein